MRNKNKYTELRKRAERLLKKRGIQKSEKYYEDLENLVEELSLHQIELELQNEELQETLKNLNTEKDKYRELYHNAPTAYTTLNATGNIFDINQTAAELFGKKLNDFRPSSFFPFVEEESKPQFVKFLKEVFTKGKADCDKISLVYPDKQIIPIKIHAKTYFDYEHQAYLCRCTLTDISDTVRRELKLRHSSRQNRLLFEHAREMAELAEENKIYRFITNSFADLYPDTIVVLMRVLPFENSEKPQAELASIAGIDKSLINKAAKIIGYEFEGKKFKIYDRELALTEHSVLVEYQGGFPEFFGKQVPANISRMLENMVKLNRIYSIGLRHEDKLHAFIHFFTRRKQVIKDFNFIEIYVQQAGFIISRLNAQKALKLSEAHHRKFVEHSPDIIYEFSNKRGALYWSQRVKDILGYRPEELKNKPFIWNESIHPEEKEKVSRAVRNFKSDDKYSVEYRIKTKQGNWVWLHDTLMHKEQKGDEIIIEGHAADITERKKLEIELKNAKERFDLAMQATKDGLWDWNPQNNEIYLSPAWKAMLGYTDNEIPNRFEMWEKLTHPEDVKKSWKEIEKVFKGEEERFELTFRMKHKQGHTVNILSRANAYFDKSGKPVRVVGTHVDISNRLELERQLKQAQRVARMGSWHWNLKTDELKWSEEQYRIFDQEPGKQFTNTEFYELVHSQDRERVIRAHEDLVRKGEFAIEFRVKIAENIKWIFERAELHRNLEGEAVFATGVSYDITEQKTAQNALKESEKRFRTIFKEDKSVKLLIKRDTGKIIDCNEAAEKFYGYADLKSMHIQEINQQSKKEIEKRMHEAVEKKLNYFLFEHRLASGEVRNVEVYSTPIEINGENLLFSNIHDVTQRRKAEAENRRLINAVEQSYNAVIITDTNGNIEYVNKRFTELTQYNLKEVIGENPRIVKSGEHDQSYYKELWDTITSGNIWSGELINKRKDGSLYWENATISPIFNVKGEIINFLAIKEDDTERKLAEQKITESRTKFKTIFDIIEVGITITDDKGNIIDCNKASEKILGITKEEHLNRNYAGKEWKIIRSDYTAMPPEEFASVRALKEDRTVRNAEMGLLKPDKITWITVSATPLQLEGYGVLIAYSDISEAKEKEDALLEKNEELEEAIATKNKFFNIIAHDLRSPFNAILGFSELLQKRHKEYDADKREKLIEPIRESASRTFKLLNNLLDWARNQTGKIPFNPEIINTKSEATDALSSLQNAADKKKIKININIPSGQYIYADTEMFRTILRNLVGNAIKFTHTGGKIKISSEQKEKTVCICVEDNGVGIAPDKLPKLFNVTQKTSTKGTENETGTGLGLLLCKDFALRHGGELKVESTLKKGSKFSLILPTKIQE